MFALMPFGKKKEHIDNLNTTSKWNNMTSLAERKNKGKAPAQGYSQDKRSSAKFPLKLSVEYWQELITSS